MKKFFTALLALGLTAGGATAGERAIKIGVIGDQSGPFADLGGKGSVVAAQMAVEDHGGRALGKQGGRAARRPLLG